jgi:hypothetical protein
MNVQFFKLITGEEILAKARDVGGHWELENPVRLAFTQQGVAMAPYAPLLKDEKIIIHPSNIIFYGEVAEEVFNAYNSKFGSGLVLAGSGLKVVGGEDD